MTSSGATTQLAAIGVQDQYTMATPDRSLWIGRVAQCTNFAMAEQECSPNGTVGFTKRHLYDIERNGDLVHRMYYTPKLPQILYDLSSELTGTNGAFYIDTIGYLMIQEIVVSIGGHAFDTHTGEFLALYDQLSVPEGKRCDMMIFQPPNGSVRTLMAASHYGNNAGQITGTYNGTTTFTVLYVPLRFWFNEAPQQALSLLNLQYHKVQISLLLRPLSEVSVESGTAVSHSTLSGSRTAPVYTTAGTDGTATTAVIPQATLETANLLVQYVYLDTAERRAFVNRPLEYLYTEVQFQGADTHTTTSGSQQFRLNFNHPVKELIWVAQDDIAITGQAGTAGLNGHEAEFVYPNSRLRFVSRWLPAQPALFATDTSNNVACPAILTSHVTLNGQYRTIQSYDSLFFRQVQPYQHHSRKPTIEGIHVYSFAYDPESLNPTGSCNMSRIDNVLHTHTFPTNTLHTFSGLVRHYARSLNVIKIVGGMAGKMFAS